MKSRGSAMRWLLPRHLGRGKSGGARGVRTADVAPGYRSAYLAPMPPRAQLGSLDPGAEAGGRMTREEYIRLVGERSVGWIGSADAKATALLSVAGVPLGLNALSDPSGPGAPGRIRGERLRVCVLLRVGDLAEDGPEGPARRGHHGWVADVLRGGRQAHVPGVPVARRTPQAGRLDVGNEARTSTGTGNRRPAGRRPPIGLPAARLNEGARRPASPVSVCGTNGTCKRRYCPRRGAGANQLQTGRTALRNPA